MRLAWFSLSGVEWFGGVGVCRLLFGG